MQVPRGLLVKVSATMLLLVFGASIAAANRSLEIEGTTTLSTSGILSFRSSEVTVECAVTLVETISRSWPKITNVLIGAMTEVRANRPEARCRSTLGELNALRFLGLGVGALWRWFAVGFTGTLPNINVLKKAVKGLQAEFELRVPLIGNLRCLYEEEEGLRGMEVNVAFRAGAFGTTTFGVNRSGRVRGTGVCPERVEFAGSFAPLQTTRVRLV